MRVQRFIWVWGPRSKAVHIKYGNTVEGPTKCGIHASPGWKWVSYRTKRPPRCKKCLAQKGTR